ncbi:MAG: hypothetical protein OXT07_15780 [bacterium]|nr:hypothetical protein [bacterium]
MADNGETTITAPGSLPTQDLHRLQAGAGTGGTSEEYGAVFDKIQEAQSLYKRYLELAALNQRAALERLIPDASRQHRAGQMPDHYAAVALQPLTEST